MFNYICYMKLGNFTGRFFENIDENGKHIFSSAITGVAYYVKPIESTDIKEFFIVVANGYTADTIHYTGDSYMDFLEELDSRYPPSKDSCGRS